MQWVGEIITERRSRIGVLYIEISKNYVRTEFLFCVIMIVIEMLQPLRNVGAMTKRSTGDRKNEELKVICKSGRFWRTEREKFKSEKEDMCSTSEWSSTMTVRDKQPFLEGITRNMVSSGGNQASVLQRR